MPILLLLLFVGVPIAEIAVFIQAGDLIGLWPTLAVILLTGVAGTILLRVQGFGVVQRIRQQADQGKPPVFELFEGLCIFAAGLLLLTPGFITDTLGFLLFLPPFRKAMARVIATRVRVHGSASFTFRGGPGGPRGPRGPGQPGGTVIDGEYETVEPDAPKINR
ncbi:MAG: FxsA family protein [Minwuia sp.]|uniref:FxsA family protein n=1 Tax=Minwuia sp. TaxID=2493630 RepID=UPI003A875C73